VSQRYPSARKSWFEYRFELYPLLETLLNGRTVTGSNAAAACSNTNDILSPVVDGSKPSSLESYDDDDLNLEELDNADDVVPHQLSFTPSSSGAGRKRSAEGLPSGKPVRKRESTAKKICEEMHNLNNAILADTKSIQDLIQPKKQRDFLEEALVLLQADDTDPTIMDIMIESINILQDATKAKTFVLLKDNLRWKWLKSLVQ
jgi:hypothetical protein